MHLNSSLLRPSPGPYSFCALLVTLAGCLTSTAPVKVTAVKQEEAVVEGEAFTVSMVNWPLVAKVQGSLFADEVSTVAAKVAGRIVEVNCDLGDEVETDQPLVKLDSIEYELLAAQAEAQLSQARAAVGLKPGDPVENLNPTNAPPVREASAVRDEALQAVKRLQTLFSQGAIVATDLEVAEAAATVADARYNSALNSVREKIALIAVQTALRDLAAQRLTETAIVAPFKGMIQNRMVAVGTYVNAGQPIVELAKTSVLRYRAALPERFASSVKVGQRVKITLHDQGSRDVKVARISPALDSISRSLTFEAEVPNEEGLLRSGSFAQADIVLDEKSQTIAIPIKSVVRFAGVDKVWKIVDGKVFEVIVQLGQEQGELVEVIAGIQEGEHLLRDAQLGRAGRFKNSAVDTQVLTAQSDTSASPSTEVETAGAELTPAGGAESLTPPSISTATGTDEKPADGNLTTTATSPASTPNVSSDTTPTTNAETVSRSPATSALGR
jgi:membrane fusion protein, multidrug efflux system